MGSFEHRDWEILDRLGMPSISTLLAEPALFELATWVSFHFSPVCRARPGLTVYLMRP